jgi:hypothetical protein
VGDPFWPEVRPDLLADPYPDPPLQLLAQQLQFTDPFIQIPLTFTSQQRLCAWPGYRTVTMNQ